MKFIIKSFLKALLALIIIFIFLNSSFHLYLYIQNKKFNKTKIGMKMEEIRKFVGKPDEIKSYNGEIMEVYYYFPTAESRFFYSNKDSILVQKWHTDAD